MNQSSTFVVPVQRKPQLINANSHSIRPLVFSFNRNLPTKPLIEGIVNQLLTIAGLIFFGFPIIFLGSIGNDVEGNESISHMFMGLVLFMALNIVFFKVPLTIPFFLSTNEDGTVKRLARYVALASASVVMAIQALHLTMLILRKFMPKKRWYESYFTFGNIGYEALIKRSALFKVERMLRNARGVHKEAARLRGNAKKAANGENDGQFQSNFSRVLNEYFKKDGQTEYIGGISWTWKKIWDGTLFTEEGELGLRGGQCPGKRDGGDTAGC